MKDLSILLSGISGFTGDNLGPDTPFVALSSCNVDVLVTEDSKNGFLLLETELYDLEAIYEPEEDPGASPRFTAECRCVMKRLRHGQFCYGETGGFRLGMRPGTGIVLLLASLPLEDANSVQVARTFGRFVRVADLWKRLLPKVAEGAEDTAAVSATAWDASAELSGAFGMRI